MRKQAARAAAQVEKYAHEVRLDLEATSRRAMKARRPSASRRLARR
jgi:hypothetical protein